MIINKNIINYFHRKKKFLITVQFINDAFNDEGLFEEILNNYKGMFKFKAYNILQDIGFNNHGCRNLAMLQSETHWNLLTDIDVYFDVETIEERDKYLLQGKVNYSPVVETLHTPVKTEIRMMYVWEEPTILSRFK